MDGREGEGEKGSSGERKDGRMEDWKGEEEKGSSGKRRDGRMEDWKKGRKGKEEGKEGITFHVSRFTFHVLRFTLISIHLCYDSQEGTNKRCLTKQRLPQM